jgi:uncharacterized protein (TIGR02145 family)
MKEVQIGKQIWMAENLNVDKFRNGDIIPQAITDEEWERAGDNGKPAYCYYNNDQKMVKKYGKLYNWYAVNDPRGLAPKGWKIPSCNDWKNLINFLGGLSIAGKNMKFTDFWAYHNGKSGSGTNASGFSGLPGGYRYYNGPFVSFGELGLWWSSAMKSKEYAFHHNMNSVCDFVYRDFDFKAFGKSVRCVRD